MSTGLILIFAVLVLGGVIATVGDRLGTRIGKARLSLFNLRPRSTATVVTILTGIVVAATTLGILFATSDPLRKGIFELGTIQRRLRRTQGELQAANDQKAKTEAELNKTRSDQTLAQKKLVATKQQLSETDQSLKSAIAERDKANTVQAQAQTELQKTQQQLSSVSGQISQLRSGISRLQAERQRVVAEGEEEIKAKNVVIKEREARLQELEARQGGLVQEIARLDQEAEGLRRGNVAIQRGQVLASAVVRIVDPPAARQAIDQLLVESNRVATQLIRPGSKPERQIIQITQAEVEQLMNKINNGRDYVVRFSSAANYLIDEKMPIQVFAEAVLNQVIFRKDDVVASTSLNPAVLDDTQIQQRINLLLASAGFRARRLGILTDTVQIGRVQNLIAFVDKLKGYNQMVELRAVASDNTFTAGPIKVNLVAAQNGQILLRSQE